MPYSQSFVYLFVDTNGTAFKIGTSIKPTSRSVQIPNSIDYDRSLQFAFPNRQASKAERTLHFLFRAHRQEREKCDGSTEWFDIACLDQVKRFMWSMRDLVGWTDWAPVQPRAPQPVTIDPIAERKEARKLRLRAESVAVHALYDKALTDRGLIPRGRPPKGRIRASSGPVKRIPVDRDTF